MSWKYFLLFVIISCVLHAEEDLYVYLTWQHDPTTTMTIHWITPDVNQNDTLFFRQKIEKKKKKKQWVQVSGMHRKLSLGLPFILHRVELQNLAPDTLYSFRFEKGKEKFLFHTMPKELTQPLRFVVGGDAYHSTLKKFRTMSEQAARANPRFAIIGGDIAYGFPAKKKKTQENDDFSRWQGFFSTWMQVMRDKEGCLIPIFTTIGNHEVKSGFSAAPEEAPLYYDFFERASYDFGFGNYAHFIFLDSGHTRPVKGQQTEWLKNTLEATTKFLHRFVTYHVAAFPSQGDFNFHVSRKIRKHWVPLFEQYRVDACFESHDHVYKRTHPLLKGNLHPQGILYFGDGAWGADPRVPDMKRPYLAHAASKQHVLVVELSQTGRKFLAIDPEGKIIDHVELPTRLTL